jgi:hypothetical protein
MLAGQGHDAPRHERPHGVVIPLFGDAGDGDRRVDDHQDRVELLDEGHHAGVVLIGRQVERLGGDEGDGQIIGELQGELEQLTPTLLFVMVSRLNPERIKSWKWASQRWAGRVMVRPP